MSAKIDNAGDHDLFSKSIDAIKGEIHAAGYSMHVNYSFIEFRAHLAKNGMYESPIFDPDEHDLTKDAFWLQIFDSDGKTIACHAERIFDCTDFVREYVATDKIWFSKSTGPDPKSWRTEVKYPSVTLSGRVGLAGSMFVDPAHRGTGLSLFLPYLSRSICIHTHKTDWNTGLVRENILHSRIPTLYYGYPRTEFLFSGTLPRASTAFQDIHLCWISKPESAEKLRQLKDHPRYAVDVMS